MEQIIQRFDEDGINLNRETQIYDGLEWYRYPNAKYPVRRNYFCKRIDGKTVSLHCYVWEKHNGKQPKGMIIDHIDENPANNDINNLQCLTIAQHNIKHKTGNKHSEKTKLKMSIASTGKLNGFYGKTHSQETKDKISMSRMGKIQSKEAKNKISISLIGNTRRVGIPHKPEIKLKMSNSAKNRWAKFKK